MDETVFSFTENVIVPKIKLNKLNYPNISNIIKGWKSGSDNCIQCNIDCSKLLKQRDISYRVSFFMYQ